jgi:peroxiredoxin
MKNFIYGLLILLAFSCNDNSKIGFSLTGTTSGIDNGTILYLENALNNKSLDSTILENNAFHFRTQLPESPLQVILRTKDYSHYRYLWLENNSMTFDGTKGDFKKANVDGSESENLQENLNKLADTLSKDEQRKLEMEFVNNNPNSIVSAKIISIYSTSWGKEKTKQLYDKFSTENKLSKYGVMIAKYIKLNKNPRIGDQFVDFEMKNQFGETKRLSNFIGKLVLLEFWSSYCGPCLQENSISKKTYEKYNSKGFEIFAVSLDEDKESWLNAIKKDNLNWIQVSDLKGQENEASLIYGINGIPDNFLIDPKGVIIGRNLRGEKLDKKIKKLLN